MINTRIKIPEHGRTLSGNTAETVRQGSSRQPGVVYQSIFKGGSNVNIVGGSFSIIGPDQMRRPRATSNLVDRGTAESNAFSEDSLYSPTNQYTFDGASNVHVNEGHFTVGRENTSGTADPNDPAPQVSHQSMFTGANNITVTNGAFTIVAGNRLKETRTKKMKPNSTSHNGMQAVNPTHNLARPLKRNCTKRIKARAILNHPVPDSDTQGTNLENTRRRTSYPRNLCRN